MTDLFHADVPDGFLDAVFAQMWCRPDTTFQVLTKRAERLAEYAASRKARGVPWPANVWAGVTVEDQRRADERTPYLLRVPAAVRFISVEPMLEAISMHSARCRAEGTCDHCPACLGGIRWVIIGSESDGPRPGARETREEWIADLVDQCDAAAVPVFLKQAAIGGRLCSLPMLDGRVRAEFPEVE